MPASTYRECGKPSFAQFSLVSPEKQAALLSLRTSWEGRVRRRIALHLPALLQEKGAGGVVAPRKEQGLPAADPPGKHQPVATSLLYLGGGVAGIYNVATLPGVRRQGIGSALTVAPLLEARTWGYRIGTLQSTPMGLHLYRRLGFREYCTFHAYFWQGEY